MEITKRNLYSEIKKKDDGSDGNSAVRNTILSHLGAFILSNSERIINNFIGEINGFYYKIIYYGDTDSVYIENKSCNVLDKANLIGKTLCQRKTDYKSVGIFLRLLSSS